LKNRWDPLGNLVKADDGPYGRRRRGAAGTYPMAYSTHGEGPPDPAAACRPRRPVQNPFGRAPGRSVQSIPGYISPLRTRSNVHVAGYVTPLRTWYDVQVAGLLYTVKHSNTLGCFQHMGACLGVLTNRPAMGIQETPRVKGKAGNVWLCAAVSCQPRLCMLVDHWVPATGPAWVTHAAPCQDLVSEVLLFAGLVVVSCKLN